MNGKEIKDSIHDVLTLAKFIIKLQGYVLFFIVSTSPISKANELENIEYFDSQYLQILGVVWVFFSV